MPGLGNAQLTDQQSKILTYAPAHSTDARITLAVEGGAIAASSYIINSNNTVIGMAGSWARTRHQAFSSWPAWFSRASCGSCCLMGTVTSAASPQGQQPGGVGLAQGNPTGGFGGILNNRAAQQRQQWVQQHCTIVDPSAYGSTTQPTQNQIGFGPFGGAQPLYQGTAN